MIIETLSFLIYHYKGFYSLNPISEVEAKSFICGKSVNEIFVGCLV